MPLRVVYSRAARFFLRTSMSLNTSFFSSFGYSTFRLSFDDCRRHFFVRLFLSHLYSRTRPCAVLFALVLLFEKLVSSIRGLSLSPSRRRQAGGPVGCAARRREGRGGSKTREGSRKRKRRGPREIGASRRRERCLLHKGSRRNVPAGRPLRGSNRTHPARHPACPR